MLKINYINNSMLDDKILKCPACGFTNNFKANNCSICKTQLNCQVEKTGMERSKLLVSNKDECRVVDTNAPTSKEPHSIQLEKSPKKVEKKDFTTLVNTVNERTRKRARKQNVVSVVQKPKKTSFQNILQSASNIFSIYSNTKSNIKYLKIDKSFLYLRQVAKDLLNYCQQIQKQITPRIKRHERVIGLGVLCLGIILLSQNLSPNWTRSLAFSGSNTEFKTEVDVPKGLFDYGGAPFFTSLVNSGINAKIESAYPEFDLRYTKPLGNFSTSNSIKSLIDGELSLVYNDRPLEEIEYKQAQLKGLEIIQTPIGIDGVVVYGNPNIPQNQLSMDLVIKIFNREVTNWKQINPKSKDLPITPVVIENENYRLPNYDKSRAGLVRVANFTQIVREVMRSPGAISLASATLLKEQELIKVFSLAEANTTNYIEPFIQEDQDTNKQKVNYKAFKEGTYPFTRKLFLVTRKDGKIQQQAGEAYLSLLTTDIGQEKMREAGFVPIFKP